MADKVELVHKVMAVVTREREKVGGGVPIFYVSTEEEQQEVAFLLGRLLDGVPHDLGNGVFIIVKY